MKLYTEEQVKKMLDLARFTYNSEDKILLSQIPIEIPSDEDIKKIMELDGMEFDEFDPYDASYLGGACWMRNKIRGDNK